MRLALGRRSRGRRVPIHDTWRREHNIWAGGWGVRITIRIRGRRIVPCIGARRRWIGCTRKGLGRVLGKCRRVGCLFSTRGSSRLFLVTAHEIFLSGVGVVLRWHGEGDKYVAGYAGHDASGTMLVEQEQGEDEGERKRGRRTSAVVVRDFKISSPLRLRLGMVLRLNFAPTGLFHDLQPLGVTVSWQRFPVRKDAVGGIPRAMMMWFGGMGRCQCTCESSKLVPTKQASLSFLFPLGAYPLPHLPLFRCRHGSKAAYSSKQCF
jgi:hypothetical protein